MSKVLDEFRETGEQLRNPHGFAVPTDLSSKASHAEGFS